MTLNKHEKSNYTYLYNNYLYFFYIQLVKFEIL